MSGSAATASAAAITNGPPRYDRGATVAPVRTSCSAELIGAQHAVVLPGRAGVHRNDERSRPEGRDRGARLATRAGENQQDDDEPCDARRTGMTRGHGHPRTPSPIEAASGEARRARL